MNYISHKDGVELIIQYYAENTVIPVFGSGFTKGAKAKNGSVPDAAEATDLMCRIIKKYANIGDKDTQDFRKAAKRLKKGVNTGTIPEKEYEIFFRNYFTEVTLISLKTDFLDLKWPFAFTLNVDDGIERNSDFSPILPFHIFRRNERKKIIYKLHGDAQTEYKYKETNIVFDDDQYLQVITDDKNKAMRESFSSAYRDFNLLFIGCSLDEESDIKYIYKSIRADRLKVKGILLKKGRLSYDEEEHLYDDYGITDIILVDDYDKFYLEITESAKNLPNDVYPFTNPSVKPVNDKELKFFSGLNVFDEKRNLFNKSSMLIERDVFQELLNCLNVYNIVVVDGRRFSGRTTLLLWLCEYEKRMPVLYFPSSTQEDSEYISDIIQNNKNILMLFDSNSLSVDSMDMIFDMKDILLNNEIRMVIMSGFGLYDGHQENVHELTLKNRFSAQEINKLKANKDSTKYIERKLNHTNLDYLLYIEEQQKKKILDISLPESYTFQEQILLVLLYVCDKVYSKDMYSIGIRKSDAQSLVDRTGGTIIELLPNKRGKRKNYSAHRLVHNSRKALLLQLKTIRFDDAIKVIETIVKKFKGSHYEQRVIYREVMKYDALNEMFGRGDGAGTLIDRTYAKLEDVLYDDLHFWLQRSKSIYHRYGKDYTRLKEAYTYAKKAYVDSTNNSRLEMQSAVSTSLVCGLLFNLETDENEKYEYLIEAIDLGYQARLSSYFDNEDYGNSKSIGQYKKLIKECCMYALSTGISERGVANKAFTIIEKFSDKDGY